MTPIQNVKLAIEFRKFIKINFRRLRRFIYELYAFYCFKRLCRIRQFSKMGRIYFQVWTSQLKRTIQTASNISSVSLEQWKALDELDAVGILFYSLVSILLFDSYNRIFSLLML